MACIMAFSGTSVIASAAETKPSDRFSSSEIQISDSTTDMYVTNNNTKQVDILRSVKESDGTYSYYGWYDVGNKKDFVDRESDFKTTTANGSIVYTAKGKDAIVIANINNGSMHTETNEITFPTPWVSDVSYGSVDSDESSELAIAALYAGVVQCPITSLILSIASYVFSQHINDTYYKKITYSRDLDTCTLQQYNVVTWYKNPNYTGSLGTTQSDIREYYLC